jgi:hypothetical protein
VQRSASADPASMVDSPARRVLPPSWYPHWRRLRSRCRESAACTSSSAPPPWRRAAGKRSEWEKVVEKHPRIPLFDEQGGTGYDRRRAPAPDCPECNGEGEGEAFFKDSLKASAQASDQEFAKAATLFAQALGAGFDLPEIAYDASSSYARRSGLLPRFPGGDSCPSPPVGGCSPT